MLDILREVQARAQRGHVYIDDIDQYGVEEYWEISLHGDCEDYALWCRQELKKHGIESDLVLCKTEQGEWHLVCGVEGWILDNRYRRVRRRDDMRYEWVALGQPDGTWRLIDV